MQNYDQKHFWKAHLSNLPKIDTFPQWQGNSQFACLLIPIFSFDGSAKNIRNYIADAAAWAMKTWKENSDAFLFNIPCYFYVEDTIAPVARDLLARHDVPANHIKEASFQNTYRLGKCLQPVFDESLEKFEYIVIADVDLFAVKGSENNPLMFFEKIRHFVPNNFGCKIFHECLPYYWFKHLREYQENPALKDIIGAWCNTVESLTGTQNIRAFIDGGVPDIRTWTGIMIIPNGIFEDKKWLETTATLLGDDEAITYTWSKVSNKNQIYDVRELEILVILDMFQYIALAFEEYIRDNGYNQALFQDIYIKSPCLLHHHASHDYKFYQILKGE